MSRPAVLVVVPEELLRSLRRARATGRVEKVRGGRAAQPRLIELFKQRIDPARPVVASIAHAKAPVWADRLRLLLAQSFQVSESIMAEMGPVVGTHAGPGTVGAALFQPTAEELPLLGPLSETA
ncbi:MAG TPA: DegV family protein [Thermoanaerobaculia bacterium]|nr:DegV family protein [Thermoanaerobaculia bacterium]